MPMNTLHITAYYYSKPRILLFTIDMPRLDIDNILRLSFVVDKVPKAVSKILKKIKYRQPGQPGLQSIKKY